MKKRLINIVLSLITLLLAVFFLFSGSFEDNSKKSLTPPAGSLQVHFLDVGQADSILILTPSFSMLIDGGNIGDGKMLVEYLHNQGVSTIDYLIATHPHEDHIGGLDDVVRRFNIGKVIMPKIVHNTKTYEYFLNALKEENLRVTTAKAGFKYSADPRTTFEILSPVSDAYDEINDYSVVIKLTHGSKTFLFTGDAGAKVENQLLTGNVNLRCDVLKVAHHGSKYSTSIQFLKAVSPQYAVICVGKDNEYDCPHNETLQRLEGIQTFRTDRDGTVIFICDGNNISVSKENNQ